ncbi:MAG: stringent starvation protein A [Gammaproteobacteria bacterium GWF2_41_13]|nr:MAG: stringent starvation protein A [Gammaproteobacteria bacterium GWF2_41_13]
MAALNNKRAAMTLYSDSQLESHRTRIVLAEKDITTGIIEVDRYEEEMKALTKINPYQMIPTLLDRDLVLYDSRIIMEYLDERFPHPPLLPVYPVARAKCRLMMYRIDQDWYPLVNTICEEDTKKAEKARKTLLTSLTDTLPAFAKTPYFLSDEFSLVDCYITPLLWRLPFLKIELPKTAKAIANYAKRVFTRPAFQQSLTDTEREMNKL